MKKTEKGEVMSRKIVGLLAVLATLGLVLGVLTPATSQAPPARTTITLIDAQKTGFEKDIDERPVGEFNAGDWFVTRDPVLDPNTCERVARVQGQGVIVKPVGERNAAFVLHGIALLADGRITFEFGGTFAAFDAPGGLEGAVTGGTGAYKDARGQVSVADGGTQCGQKVDLITLDLLLQ
ncbi:MAG: hypothetical protein ACRDKB_04695 [Actinomycetota bacterium]